MSLGYFVRFARWQRLGNPSLALADAKLLCISIFHFSRPHTIVLTTPSGYDIAATTKISVILVTETKNLKNTNALIYSISLAKISTRDNEQVDAHLHDFQTILFKYQYLHVLVYYYTDYIIMYSSRCIEGVSSNPAVDMPYPYKI